MRRDRISLRDLSLFFSLSLSLLSLETALLRYTHNDDNDDDDGKIRSGEGSRRGGKTRPFFFFHPSIPRFFQRCPATNTIRRRVPVYSVYRECWLGVYLSSNGRASLLWWSREGGGGGSVSNIVPPRCWTIIDALFRRVVANLDEFFALENRNAVSIDRSKDSRGFPKNFRIISFERRIDGKREKNFLYVKEEGEGA